MAIRPADPFGSFVAGRQARQQEEYGNTRNALARMEYENAPQEMATRNALGRQQVEGGQMSIDAARAKEGYARLRQALDSGNPRQYVLEREPQLAAKLREHGVDLASIDDQAAMRVLDGFAREYAGKAGIMPTQRVETIGDTSNPGAGILQKDPVTGELKQVVAPQRPAPVDHFAEAEAGRDRRAAQKPGSRYRALTPQEIQQAGLPSGSSAQVDLDTGKIDVLSKRDQTATLSQKDATTAKIKLNTVKLARQQLNAIKDAFSMGTEGVNAFGPGQSMLPTQAGKLFDSRVDQMRSTLTALTRVPGVGSMSDYETKLDQSKFPKRGDYETVTSDKLQQLDDMLSLIENGYTGLIGASEQGQQPAAQPTQQQAPPAALDYLQANPQFKGAFFKKYGYLPPGM